MSGGPILLELRANVAVRILIERVELESHPALAFDTNGARRAAWQDLASSAIAGVLGTGNGAPAARTPPKKRPTKRKEARRRLSSGELVALAVDGDVPAPELVSPGVYGCIVCAEHFTPHPKHRGRQRVCGTVVCTNTFRNAKQRLDRMTRRNGGRS
jgi:hypothetical protein